MIILLIKKLFQGNIDLNLFFQVLLTVLFMIKSLLLENKQTKQTNKQNRTNKQTNKIESYYHRLFALLTLYSQGKVMLVNNCNPKLKRFMNYASIFPIEIQMRICSKVYDIEEFVFVKQDSLSKMVQYICKYC